MWKYEKKEREERGKHEDPDFKISNPEPILYLQTIDQPSLIKFGTYTDKDFGILWEIMGGAGWGERHMNLRFFQISIHEPI